MFLLLIESNIGFKWFFNFTNYFFLGSKVEKISGNWRDFTLQNIYCNILGMSVKAKKIRCIIDYASFFKMSLIIKEIETKDMQIKINDNQNAYLKKNISKDNFKKSIFLGHSLTINKIHFDKIFFKTAKKNIFLSDIFTGIQWTGSNLVIFPSYISDINIEKSNIQSKIFIQNQKIFKKKDFNSQKISNFFRFFSEKIKNLILLNTDLKNLICANFSFVDDFNNKQNISEIEIKAQIKNNTIKIKKFNSRFHSIKIKSYGQIVLKNNCSIFSTIHSEISTLELHDKILNLSIKSKLNNKFKFILNVNNLMRTNVQGVIFLNRLNCPFQVKLSSTHFFLPIEKKIGLRSNSFSAILKGNINNYFLSLQNILYIKNFPSILFKLNSHGNLKNIFLDKLIFLPIKNIHSSEEKNKLIFNKKEINSNDTKYNQILANLIGKLDISVTSSEKSHNLSVPQIRFNGNIMNKKFSILSSLFYKNFSFLDIPKMNISLGKNKAWLKGMFNKNIYVNSAFCFDHLDYFSPFLKGVIKGKFHLSGSRSNPRLYSSFSANHVIWNDFNLNKMEISSRIHSHNKISGNFLFDIKKMNSSFLNIDFLKIRSFWNDKNQKFYFSLKNKDCFINFVFYGILNKKTKFWNGFFKKIDIQTSNFKWIIKKNIVIRNYNIKKKTNDYIQKKLKNSIKLSNFLLILKNFFKNSSHGSILKFHGQTLINAELKWLSDVNFINGTFILESKKLILEKITKEKSLIKKINFLNFSINLKGNNLTSHWILKNSNHLLEESSLLGFLNINDVYNTKIIHGKCFILNFPVSIIDFFTVYFQNTQGVLIGNMNFSGSLYNPKIVADINLKNIFIKGRNLLTYISMFFCSFFNYSNYIDINQEIIIKKGSLFFQLSLNRKKQNGLEWSILFNSDNFKIEIFPRIQFTVSSQLNFHYFLSKCSMNGYLKFLLFYFYIHENNIII